MVNMQPCMDDPTALSVSGLLCLQLLRASSREIVS